MFKAKHLLLALAILGAAAPATDAADATAQLKAAKAAYDRKDYEKAQEIWQPLAEAGNLSAQYNLAVLLRNKEDIVNQVKAGNGSRKRPPPATLRPSTPWESSMRRAKGSNGTTARPASGMRKPPKPVTPKPNMRWAASTKMGWA